MSDPKIYKLETTLVYLDLFRQVLVYSDTPLEKFHAVIQATMGWFNRHLHQFETSDGQTITNSGFINGAFDAQDELDGENMTIESVLKRQDEWMLYTYDMEDNRDHEIVLQEILPVNEAQTYPQCIGGANACPIEDSGGLQGYEDLLETLSDPNNPEYEEISCWILRVTGVPTYDPRHFDKNDANRRLANLSLYEQ
ncbi:uncharacterized protein ATC70_008292 [Mucor velutinosus]|uniref:Plasmid pRiA4b Orf3-like domain-containing protein n=1 Tax=Mucor velutinosus TaxID=708070 RepID=A0AAN7I3R9_9FUNG|nr:hypothetical protein ATC70_008292 [Mucor velutinosus]